MPADNDRTDRRTTYLALLSDVRRELGQRRAELSTLGRIVADLESQEALLTALCGEEPAPTPESQVAQVDEPVAPASSGAREIGSAGPGASFSSTVRRIARSLIASSGRPVPRSEIVDALQQTGVPLPERNPLRKITKILSMDRGLTNIRNEGYLLMEYEETEPAGPIGFQKTPEGSPPIR